MKACWNELFALGLAQCSNVMNVGTILSAIITHLQTSLQEGIITLLYDAEKPTGFFCSGMYEMLHVKLTLDLNLMFFFYNREAVSRSSKARNGAHLEDAGVL